MQQSAAAAPAGHKEQQEQPNEIQDRLDAVFTQNRGALNKAAADAGIPPVVVEPVERRRWESSLRCH